jgi:hypothetical protein
MTRQTGQRQRAAIRWPVTRHLAGGGFIVAAAVLSAVLVGVVPAGASAAATCLPGAGVQPVSPGTHVNELQGVAVLSACDAWAVGFEGDDSTRSTDEALIEHWDGRSWTVVPSPDPGNTKNELTSVRAISPANVWAVGFFDNGVGPRTLILHWNGKAWKRAPSPNPSDSEMLASVRFVSAKDGWAVGSFNDGTDRTLTLRWNGKAWKRVPSPSFMLNSSLNAVSAVSPRNVWAVGQTSSRTQLRTLILHWNGTRWSRVASPNAGLFSGLTSAAATSATNVWAVGELLNTLGNLQTLILHWNGTAWKRVSSPNPGGPARSNQLNAVTASSGTSARAVGTFTDPVLGQTTLILRWNGTRWTHVVTPASELGELLAVTGTSPGSSWAVGDSFDPNSQVIQAMALHCC